MSDYTAHYRHTHDSLTPASLAVLVDLAEGVPHAGWVYDALERCGLVYSFEQLIAREQAEGIYWRPQDQLTDYGKAFIAWYRQPRDLPAQLSLFGGDA